MISDNSVCVKNDGAGVTTDDLSQTLTNSLINSEVAIFFAATVSRK